MSDYEENPQKDNQYNPQQRRVKKAVCINLGQKREVSERQVIEEHERRKKEYENTPLKKETWDYKKEEKSSGVFEMSNPNATYGMENITLKGFKNLRTKWRHRPLRQDYDVFNIDTAEENLDKVKENLEKIAQDEWRKRHESRMHLGKNAIY